MLAVVAFILAQCTSLDDQSTFASGRATALSPSGGALVLDADAGLAASRLPGVVSGSYESRVHAFAQQVTLDRVELRTIYPAGLPLPLDGGIDPFASSGRIAMAGNTLLLPFDERGGAQAFDQSPVHLVGVFDGGITFGAPGLFGTSATFDGGCLVFPDVPALNPNGTLTLAAWIRPRGLDGARAEGIFSKRIDYSVQAQFTFFIWSGNRLFVDLDTENDRISGNVALNNDEWVHVAMVFDGQRPTAQRLRIFVNGAVDVVAAETSATLPPQPATFVVGCLPNPAGGTMQTFEGEIDEAAVFLRALTDLEVNGLYARGASRHRLALRTCPTATCATAGAFTPILPGRPVSFPPTQFAQYRLEAEAPSSALYWSAVTEVRLEHDCPDAGSLDAGPTDAGTTDAGPTDAGTTDAGTTDAGTTDAGSTDAGQTDAGLSDAGKGDAGNEAGDAGNEAVDAGAPEGGLDAGFGGNDGGLAVAPNYDVGCGCSAGDGRWLLLLLAWRRRKSESRAAGKRR